MAAGRPGNRLVSSSYSPCPCVLNVSFPLRAVMPPIVMELYIHLHTFIVIMRILR